MTHLELMACIVFVVLGHEIDSQYIICVGARSNADDFLAVKLIPHIQVKFAYLNALFESVHVAK